MKIVVVGRGNVGGGVAEPWRKAGHDVTTLGPEGGDAAGADVVVVAVPQISPALNKVSNLAGKPAIDATNPIRRVTAISRHWFTRSSPSPAGRPRAPLISTRISLP